MQLNHPKRIFLGTGTYYDAGEMDAFLASARVDEMILCMQRAVYLCEDRGYQSAAGMFRGMLNKLQGKEEG
jgi:hypothetical protein